MQTIIAQSWKWLLVVGLILLLHSHRINDSKPVDVDGQAELRNLLINPERKDLHVSLSPEIQRFYFLSGESLAWSHRGVPTPQAFALKEAIRNAREKGLDPEDYAASDLNSQLLRISQGQPTCDELAKFDIAFTAAAIHFATDLSVGRIDPRRLRFGLSNARRLEQIPDFVFSRLVNSADVTSGIAGLEPPFGGYHRTGAALAKYLTMAAAGEDPPLPIPARVVNVGDSFLEASQLRSRLTRLGDLSQGDDRSPIYSISLANGVKHFQQRHGLEPTGAYDRATATELNVPLSKRATQLALTLERWRWLPPAFVQPPVVVNIPEFRLRAFDENHHEAITMSVIVGQAYEHQTPVFQEDLQYVIFRPYWNVPLSIQRAELIPEIEKDPSFLVKHGFEITSSDGTISTTAVTSSMLQQLRSGQLEIRQRPGVENALGPIKFVFPNEYDVYLHGTPAQELFRRSRRDFSHGCIRVEDPIGLARWVFRSDPSWTVQRIRAAMTGKDSFQVRLPNAIPVLILYGTAVVEENGDVHFFHDIYGHDAALLQALQDHSKQDQRVLASRTSAVFPRTGDSK